MTVTGAANDDPSDPPAEVVSASPRPRSLSQRILRGGAWSLIGRVGSMGSLFLFNVVLARALSKDDYAAFLAAASVAPLLAMIATMGVPLTLIRVLRTQVSDHMRRREAIRGAMTLTAIGGLATVAVYCVAARMLPDEAKWDVVRDLPGYVSAWFLLSALCMVGANYLQAEDQFRAASLVGARNGGVIPNVLALTVAALAAWTGVLTLGVVLFLQVAAYLVSLAVAAWLISRTFHRPAERPAGATPAAARFSARWYLLESWPNLLNQAIAVLLTEVDQIWVTWLAGVGVAADYGAIRNLRLLVVAPLLVASVSLPPFIAELHGRGDLRRMERLIRGAATVLALPSLAALAVLLAAPEFVIRLVYGESFVDAATALQIMSVGAIVFVLTGNNGMALTMTGRHRDLLVCSLSSLGLYIAISPPLVARYGVTGAALAFTIQTIFQNVIVTLRVRQKVGIWTIPLTSWTGVREAFGSLSRPRRN